MRRALRIVAGPVTIAQDMRLRGIIAGDATVLTGAYLDLDGTIDGNLTIEHGASVSLRGVVSADIINRGTCHVSGWGDFDYHSYERAVRAALYPRRCRSDRPDRSRSDTASASTDLRASDAEREAVVARLHEHWIAGRLDISELEERLQCALMARMHAELARLEHDLPNLSRTGPSRSPPPRRGVKQVRSALPHTDRTTASAR